MDYSADSKQGFMTQESVIEIGPAEAADVRGGAQLIFIFSVVSAIINWSFAWAFLFLYGLRKAKPLFMKIGKEALYGGFRWILWAWCASGFLVLAAYVYAMAQMATGLLASRQGQPPGSALPVGGLTPLVFLLSGAFFLNFVLWLAVLVFTYKLFRVFAKVFAGEGRMGRAKIYCTLYCILGLVATNLGYLPMFLFGTDLGAGASAPQGILQQWMFLTMSSFELLTCAVVILKLAGAVFIVFFFINLYGVLKQIRPVARRAMEVYED